MIVILLVCGQLPMEKKNNKIAERKLVENFEVYYSQDVYFTRRGLRNFLVETYGTQAWMGSIGDGYKGIDGKLNLVYEKRKPIKVFLFKADSLERVLEVKELIRNAYGMGKDSIHMTDYAWEARRMAKIVFAPDLVSVYNNIDLYANSYTNNVLASIAQANVGRDVCVMGKTVDFHQYQVVKILANNSCCCDHIDDLNKSGHLFAVYDKDDCCFIPAFEICGVNCYLENRGVWRIFAKMGEMQSVLSVPSQYRYSTQNRYVSFLRKNKMYGQNYTYDDYSHRWVSRLKYIIRVPYRFMKKILTMCLQSLL